MLLFIRVRGVIIDIWTVLLCSIFLYCHIRWINLGYFELEGSSKSCNFVSRWLPPQIAILFREVIGLFLLRKQVIHIHIQVLLYYSNAKKSYQCIINIKLLCLEVQSNPKYICKFWCMSFFQDNMQLEHLKF